MARYSCSLVTTEYQLALNQPLRAPRRAQSGFLIIEAKMRRAYRWRDRVLLCIFPNYISALTKHKRGVQLSSCVVVAFGVSNGHLFGASLAISPLHFPVSGCRPTYVIMSITSEDATPVCYDELYAYASIECESL